MTLFRHPLFLTGLVIKITMILTLRPRIHEEWFGPFLLHVSAENWWDPWTSYIVSGGDFRAFPYGTIFVAVFAPLAQLFALGSDAVGLNELEAASYGISFSVLALEIALLVTLRAFALNDRNIIVYYWLSPLALYLSYYHGQLDVLPALLLTMTIAAIRTDRDKSAGVAFALAVAAKLSSAIIAPIVAFYYLKLFQRNRRLQLFAVAFLGVILSFLAPNVFSDGYQQMSLGSPEFGRFFALRIELGQVKIYLTPIIFTGFLYFIWRLRRITVNIFETLVTLTILLFLSLTPASPGWFYWVLPFLVIYLDRGSRLTQLYLLLTVLRHLIESSGARWIWQDAYLDQIIHARGLITGEMGLDILVTAQHAVAFILIAKLVWDRILHDLDYSLASRPVVIGIAGDSGSGKDTLAAALGNLFAGRQIAHLSGDDYHLWDRERRSWLMITHLNPRANDLQKFGRDIIDLSKGRAIEKRQYDHTTGKRSQPKKMTSGDLVIVSGLHTLLPLTARKRMNLKIFLDIDNALRILFKIQRDVIDRGYLIKTVIKNIERRSRDRERFILPQKDQADLIFALRPVEPLPDPYVYATMKTPPHIELAVTFCNELDVEPIVKALIVACNAHVWFEDGVEGMAQQMVIRGEIGAHALEAAAAMAAPEFDEHFKSQMKWLDGYLGVMQLIVVNALSQNLRMEN